MSAELGLGYDGQPSFMWSPPRAPYGVPTLIAHMLERNGGMAYFSQLVIEAHLAEEPPPALAIGDWVRFARHAEPLMRVIAIEHDGGVTRYWCSYLDRNWVARQHPFTRLELEPEELRHPSPAAAAYAWGAAVFEPFGR
jgi:hypothetical protein